MTSSVQPLDTICFRCGECCRRYQVLLDCSELESLAKHLKISAEEFRAQYADLRWPGEDKCLIRRADDGCPFMRGENKEYLCTVHTQKPQPCRDWAASLDKPECRQGLKKFWQLAVDSTGHLQGTPEDIRAFHSFLTACTKEEQD